MQVLHRNSPCSKLLVSGQCCWSLPHTVLVVKADPHCATPSSYNTLAGWHATT